MSTVQVGRDAWRCPPVPPCWQDATAAMANTVLRRERAGASTTNGRNWHREAGGVNSADKRWGPKTGPTKQLNAANLFYMVILADWLPKQDVEGKVTGGL